MSETTASKRPAPLQPYMKTQSNPRGQSDLQPLEDLTDYVTKFAKEQPQTAALWCFGIGFLVGWKLKPW